MNRKRILAAAAALSLTAGALASSALADREAGLSSDRVCAPPDLSVVTPEDARGTTFVGTYEGDMASGREAGWMIVFWAVERVHAGDAVPRDLVYQTPVCEWTNLTPGVRYLFSTAASDLSLGTDATGGPSVADSLAWRLDADGAATLAPFDTYAIGDYARAVQDIDSLEAALAAVAPDGGPGEAPDRRGMIDFGCTANIETAAPDEVRGTTFIGRYIGDEVLPAGGIPDVRVYWSVERVLAGGPLPEILTLRSDGCQDVRLRPGARYLFSTADPLWPSRRDSLAWRLDEADGLRLEPFRGYERSGYPRAARSLRQLDEALAAVAPDAGKGEPPARAADRTPG